MAVPIQCGMHAGVMGYGWLFQILILVLFFLVLWWLLKGQSRDSPTDVLKKRLASGEITEKKYKKLKKELE